MLDQYDISFASMQPGIISTDIQRNFRRMDSADFPPVYIFTVDQSTERLPGVADE